MTLNQTFQTRKPVLILVILSLCFAIGQTRFDQSVIDRAMTTKFVSYRNSGGSAPSVVNAAQAFYYLTLVASINPQATASNGSKVKDRVIATFRNLVAGGNEPQCSNPLGGWSDGAIGLSLALIKNTSTLWNSLNSVEHAKADWLMKALAITGNWAFNDQNYYKTGLGMGGNFQKTNNPNYIQGYMGVMTAFSIYFGASAGNAILTSFSYNDYISQFKAYKWTNIFASWQATGKNLMEQGGSDGMGGYGKGVKLAFKWNGYTLDDLNGIYYSQSVTGSPSPMYSRTVVNAVGSAHILSGSSPVLGEFGMCLEFNSTDSSGLRSDALYVYEGWMNSVITRATLKRLGIWGGPNVATVEKLMLVGSTDLIYKLSKGYQGINVHGAYITNDSQGGLVDAKGYPLLKDIWYNYINSAMSNPALSRL